MASSFLLDILNKLSQNHTFCLERRRIGVGPSLIHDKARMNDLMWGMLGPENVHSERRTRTLELGAAVRHFNELAVPGLGGVWFGKQLFLALLGIAVAERVRSRRSVAGSPTATMAGSGMTV